MRAIVSRPNERGVREVRIGRHRAGVVIPGRRGHYLYFGEHRLHGEFTTLAQVRAVAMAGVHA